MTIIQKTRETVNAIFVSSAAFLVTLLFFCSLLIGLAIIPVALFTALFTINAVYFGSRLFCLFAVRIAAYIALLRQVPDQLRAARSATGKTCYAGTWKRSVV